MKRLCLFLIALVLSACEGETVYNPNNHPCPEGQIQVMIAQPVKFTNSENNWASGINYEGLSLIATDSLGNYLYSPNGDLITDRPNFIEVHKEFDDNNHIERLTLVLGHVPYRDEVSKTAKAYFLLKIDDTTFDKIIGYYDTRCFNLLLTKISYNDVEFEVSDYHPIEITKGE